MQTPTSNGQIDIRSENESAIVVVVVLVMLVSVKERQIGIRRVVPHNLETWHG